MFRIDDASAAGSLPTPEAAGTEAYFTEGVPGVTPATLVRASWANMIQEELRAVVVAGGLTPSKTAYNQVMTAIKAMIDVQAGNYCLDTGAANAYVIALDPVVTSYTNGMTVRFRVAHANTTASTLNAGGGAVALNNDVGGALAPGDLPASCIVAATYDSTATAFLINSMVPSQALTLASAAAYFAPIRNYLSGYIMSTTGGSGTMTIGSGQAADSTNAATITVASNYTKTTSSWAVGSANGGLDTGSIANSTWYYFYAILRPDTGVTDVIFSTSASAPTLPTNYTKYRYIGAGLIDGSGHWTKFTQSGREFWWSTPVLDVSVTGSTTAALATCSIPLGRKMKGIFNLGLGDFNGLTASYLSDPDNADLAVSSSVSPLSSFGFGQDVASGAAGAGQVSVWTNTSAQIRHRELNTQTVYLATLGWIDMADTNI